MTIKDPRSAPVCGPRLYQAHGEALLQMLASQAKAGGAKRDTLDRMKAQALAAIQAAQRIRTVCFGQGHAITRATDRIATTARALSY